MTCQKKENVRILIPYVKGRKQLDELSGGLMYAGKISADERGSISEYGIKPL
jgi:hypothetical protein